MSSYQEYKLINQNYLDLNELVYIGDTPSGIPIDIYRAALDADFILGIGNIVDNYFGTAAFSIAFPTNIPQVMVSLYSYNGSAFDASIAVTNRSLTGFGFTIQEWSGVTQALDVAYIAIGA